MADAVTAALLKEAGQSGGRPAGFPVESPQEKAYRMERRAQTLQGELANPELMGGESARPAVERELARMGPQYAAAPAQPGAPRQEAANDPITTALLGEAKGISDQAIPGNEGALAADRNKGKPERTLTEEAKLLLDPRGPLEMGASMATGIVGGLVGNVAGLVKGLTGGKYGTPEGAAEAARYAQEVAHSMTYQPRTESGKAKLEGVAELAQQTGANRLAGLGPAEGMALAGLTAAPAASKAAQAIPRGTAAAEAPAARVAGQFGSAGAAGASLGAQAEAIAARGSPELQRIVAEVVRKKGDKLSPKYVEALERHVLGESLPVPIKYTAGQATQDPKLISNERNSRGGANDYANRFNEQNKKLKENLNAIREEAAPDVYVTSRPEVADIVMSGYRAEDAARNSVISANYKALRDANGGHFPMDAKAFVANAEAALRKELKSEFVPPAIAKQLRKFKAGEPMTFEQFEAMRTNLAAEIRKAKRAGDGNSAFASSVVYQALDDLPMPAGAEHLKPLADKARASARERFELLRGDPAYRAVVNGTAKADNFINKFLMRADTRDVEAMVRNLENQPVARQALSAGAMDKLKESARITSGDQGNFAQAGYNKTLDNLRQSKKLDLIFDAKQRANVENLGTVARDIQGQPAGSFVNNSNSAVALLAEAAKSGLEAKLNTVTYGGATAVRRGYQYLQEHKAVGDALQTGAGIRLKDVK